MSIKEKELRKKFADFIIDSIYFVSDKCGSDNAYEYRKLAKPYLKIIIEDQLNEDDEKEKLS